MFLIRLIFLFLLASTPVNGSEYYWLYLDNLKNSERKEFFDGKLKEEVLVSIDSIHKMLPPRSYFFYNGNEIQTYIECGFELYSINGTELELKYKYYNRGYTCGTTPFVRDSTNYLIGGVGFWTNHIDLLWFDETTGSWEFTKTINQPMDYFSQGIFQSSKGVYSLFGGYYNLRTGIDERELNGYFLEWESKEWKKIEIQIEGINNSDYVEKNSPNLLQTKDFVFMVSTVNGTNTGWNIIEKESGIIYFYRNIIYPDVFISPFMEVIGNTINYQTQNGTLKSLDLANLVSDSKKVGRIVIVEGGMTKSEVSKEIIYVPIIIVLAVGIILLSFFRKSKENSPIPILTNGFDEIEKLVQSLLQNSGQLLNTEQLDDIFGIESSENLDSKRLKRSRMISRINEYYKDKNGKDLIERVKNPEDKRYTYYRI